VTDGRTNRQNPPAITAVCIASNEDALEKLNIESKDQRHYNFTADLSRDVSPWELGLKALALALLSRPTLRPRPDQTHCHYFINADEFDPDLFPLCILSEPFSLLKPLLECVFCVPAFSAPLKQTATYTIKLN